MNPFIWILLCCVHFLLCPVLPCRLKHRPICKATRPFKVLIRIKLPFNWIRITNWSNEACVIEWERYYSTVLFSCTTGVIDHNCTEQLSPCPCSPSASPSRSSGRCQQPARWENLSGKTQKDWSHATQNVFGLNPTGRYSPISIHLPQLTHLSTTPTSVRQSLTDLIVFICSKNDFPPGLES